MAIKKINKTVKIDIKEALKDVLPQVFEDNKVNFNKLKSLLSDEIVEKADDRFYFNWADKSNLFRLIQAPAYGALKPDKKNSVDFDKTENLMIVGENLEILKLLLKPYFGMVKLIYIDPPYNTGKDFIYRDNFKESLKDYLEKTGQISSEGDKLTTNTETSGRYHSDWLNFIYPRLFLARSLLKEDGVIFISIDDNELHHLKIVMDEVFGEENFVGQIVVRSNPRGSQSSRYLATEHEYLIMYSKNITDLELKGYDLGEATISEYKYTYKDGRKYRLLGLRQRGGAWRREQRPKMYFPIYINPKTGAISLHRTSVFCKEALPKRPSGEEGRWKWGKEKVEKYRDHLVGKKVKREGEKDFWDIFQIDFLQDEQGEERTAKVKTIWLDKELNYQNGRAELKELFDGKDIFDYPKPTFLIKKIVEMFEFEADDIILDFFAGSGTTGHAVWNLNKDGVNRKTILIQLDEPVDKNTEAGKAALKLGLKTVADICIERLKRVSKKYKENKTLFSQNQDFGFKVLKLDKSNLNLKDEFEIVKEKDAKELKKKYLEWLGIWVKEPLVPGWKPLDVVYEVMLKEGFDLNSDVKEIQIKSNNFWHVIDKKKEQEFYISLDKKVNKATIEEIRTAKYKNKMFVFLDKSLGDNEKLNLRAFVRIKVI